MRMPSEPLTSNVSPGRSSASRTGNSAARVVDVRAAPCRRQGVVQMAHRRAGGVHPVDAAARSIGEASSACSLGAWSPSSSMSPSTASLRPGAVPSTASAARTDAGLAL